MIGTSVVKELNWTCMKRSEDVHDGFWTISVRSIYVLCPGDLEISITIILYTAYFVLTIVWVQ